MGYEGARLSLCIHEMLEPTRHAGKRMTEEAVRFLTEMTRLHTPEDTGHLKSSWSEKPILMLVRPNGELEWSSGVETHVDYACVFGPSTAVVTSEGRKRIADIREGDYVLTQAGDFQRVLAATSFPAIEKPDLVELAVPWRAGSDHRLTLTLDHKVLVAREGRNLWVEAGNLRDGDMMYERRKLAHNLGTGVVKVCEWCDRRHQRQGRRYCSVKCRDLAWAAGANPHLGAIRSDATREKLRQACIERGAGRRMNQILAQNGYITSYEREVEEWLIGRGVEYERQVEVGGYVVDFFLPVEREVIEADGAYWHQDQMRDIERDAELLRVLPGVEITHLHFHDSRFSPPLDPEPLPGVRYVTCNPGPKSYVDPALFEQRPVRVVREWVYGDSKPEKQGTWSARLHDISVEGVHSFLASGLVVSNSYVEHGTGLWGPKHMKYLIVPKKPGGVLHWIAGDGSDVFATRVWHPGSPGAHMVAIAVAETEAALHWLLQPVLEEWKLAAEAAFARGGRMKRPVTRL